MLKPDPHTAIAERLEACLVRASATMTVAAIDKDLLREAAQALRASADEVEAVDLALHQVDAPAAPSRADRIHALSADWTATSELQEESLGKLNAELERVKGDLDEANFAYNTSYDLGSQWVARAEKAEADLASARKALEEMLDTFSADPSKSEEVYAEELRARRIAREALRASTIGEEGEGSAQSCHSSAQEPTAPSGWREALEKAAARFREYEASYRRQAAEIGVARDRLVKAKRNAEMAELCEEALSTIGVASGAQHRKDPMNTPPPPTEEVASSQDGLREKIEWIIDDYVTGSPFTLRETANAIVALFQPEGRARSAEEVAKAGRPVPPHGSGP